MTPLRVRLVALALVGGCSQGDDPVFLDLGGSVNDASTGLPVPSAEVTLRDRLGNETPTTTDADGQWSVDVILAGEEPLPIDIEVAHPNFVGTVYHYQVRLPPESDARLEIRPGGTERPRGLLIPGIPVAPNSPSPGTLRGNVFDATVDRDFDPEPWFINGLPLTLRSGMRTLEGEAVATAESGTLDPEGGFEMAAVPPGTYTLSVEGGSDFSDAFVTVVVIGGTTRTGQNIGTAAAIGEEDFRFVLSWGATPSDLDSHLWGPNPRATDGLPFHIFFPDEYRYAPIGDTEDPFGTLDVDDVTSFGPETVTLLGRAGNRYRYYVHDYSNLDKASSFAMSESGAKVQVWSGSSYDSFEITPGSDATVWHVADIDGATGWIYFVNEFDHQSSPDLVGDITTD